MAPFSGRGVDERGGARGVRGAAPARRPALKPWGSPAGAKVAGARGERERKRSPLGKGTAEAAARPAPGASPSAGRPLPDDDLEEKFGSFLANLRTQRAELVAISESPAKPPAPVSDTGRAGGRHARCRVSTFVRAPSCQQRG